MSDYQEYLQTEHWKILAEETKRLAGYRCQVCNSNDDLHAHHRTYERRGDELQSDLICLCKKCHELFHRKRSTVDKSKNEYKGIYIHWDEDYDERVYEAIDIICKLLKNRQLPVAVAEHEGYLTTYWRGQKDLWRGQDYLKSGISLDKGCDYWNIGYEISVLKIRNGIDKLLGENP